MENDISYIIEVNGPDYETPTGRIVGGPYLGKKHIGEGFFPEGAANVDPKITTNGSNLFPLKKSKAFGNLL